MHGKPPVIQVAYLPHRESIELQAPSDEHAPGGLPHFALAGPDAPGGGRKGTRHPGKPPLLSSPAGTPTSTCVPWQGKAPEASWRPHAPGMPSLASSSQAGVLKRNPVLRARLSPGTPR
jgi:hypothetical protein